MGCTAELCASGGYGAIIDLDDVNVALENLPPEVIAVGETQERLCWILPGDVTLDVLRIYNEEFSLPEIARGARAVVIGAVQDEKRYVVRHSSKIVMDVPIDFLTGAISNEARLSAGLAKLGRASTGVRKANAAHHDKGGEGALLTQSMADINACSREPLYKEYDAVVRGTTVIPRGTADAGVIVPLPGAKFGVALSVGRSVREAVRKIVAVGARPIGLTDCLNFGNPNNEEHYAQLVSAVDTLSEEAKNLGLPFVSGNVSLYNESSSGTAIPSSPIIGCVGVVDDVSKVVTPALKHPGSPLYFIEDKRVAAVLEAIEGRLILSARAIGGDGVLAAAAQMAFASGNDFGVEFETDITSQTFDGGWLVEAAETAAFEDWQRLGITTVADIEGEVDITSGGESWDLDELRAAWVEPLGEIYA